MAVDIMDRLNIVPDIQRIRYRIDVYSVFSHKYVTFWVGNSVDMAKRMINKPYYGRTRRRIVQELQQVVWIEEAKHKRARRHSGKSRS